MQLPLTAAAATFGSTVNRPPLNPQDAVSSPAVMAWLSPSGETRSLPTNIRDPPQTINQVRSRAFEARRALARSLTSSSAQNSLRSVRKSSLTNPLPEGGHSFVVGVNVDNWVEERRDRSHKSGSVPVARYPGMYRSEYMERSNEACAAYRSTLASSSLVSQVPAHGQEYRNSRRVGYESNYIAYARDGFSRGASMRADATCVV